MVLKYGEIYVYHNQNEESIGNTFWIFLDIKLLLINHHKY